ncbi:MAG: beta-lactamase family protein [Oscillospiraceae bacterium]|nr:beta-lactamase family protein [Oscillospiraceae bacterium]
MPISIFRPDIYVLLKYARGAGYGASAAVAAGESRGIYCYGTSRHGKTRNIERDTLFQAGSVSKPAFALTLLRYADRGELDIDADISGYLSEFVDSPLTFSALLSHTAGFNVHGFRGYRADAPAMSLEDVILGKGNSPKVEQVKPYRQQYMYSGGGITLAELAFTRIMGKTLRDAFAEEVAEPLGLKNTGYFQPLDEERAADAAFGGRLGEKEDRNHGWHYYPEHAAAGLWTTPSELVTIGLELSRSYRDGGLLKRETAVRMMTPVMKDYGLCMSVRDGCAGHSGWNEGFLTYWKFSLTEDRCAAVMVNKTDLLTSRMLARSGDSLFSTFGNR